MSVRCSAAARSENVRAVDDQLGLRLEFSRRVSTTEGFGLHLFDFVKGETVEVAERLAEMLLLCDYAAPERHGEQRWITNGLSRRAAF